MSALALLVAVVVLIKAVDRELKRERRITAEVTARRAAWTWVPAQSSKKNPGEPSHRLAGPSQNPVRREF